MIFTRVNYDVITAPLAYWDSIDYIGTGLHQILAICQLEPNINLGMLRLITHPWFLICIHN